MSGQDQDTSSSGNNASAPPALAPIMANTVAESSGPGAPHTPPTSDTPPTPTTSEVDRVIRESMPNYHGPMPQQHEHTRRPTLRERFRAARKDPKTAASEAKDKAKDKVKKLFKAVFGQK